MTTHYINRGLIPVIKCFFKTFKSLISYFALNFPPALCFWNMAGLTVDVLPVWIFYELIGMLGSGRVAPMTTADNLHPGITGPARLSPSPRPRSSPRIRRRYTRVTPLPPTTQLQLPPDARNTADHTYHKVPHMYLNEDLQGACNTSHPSKVPNWKRDHQQQSHKGTNQDDNEGLWPSSSLDSGLLDHAPTYPTNTTSQAMATAQVPLAWLASPPRRVLV